jgi:hypothetical protein
MAWKTGKLVPLLLDEHDLGQAIDGISIRAEAYERTAAYLEGEEEDDPLDPFIIEEVNNSSEARGIAEHYRRIEAELRRQWKQWQETEGDRDV